MGIVYILFSLKDYKTYTGSTDNFERRFQQHKSGQVKATRNILPLKLFFTETFPTLEEARKREIWWKSSNGRRKLKTYFKNYEFL